MTPLRSKADSLAFLASPRWNQPRVWPSIAAMRDSGFKGNVVIRSYRPSFATIYNWPQEHLDAMLANLADNGHPTDTLYCNEAMPDDRLVLQGELIGHSLTYTTAPLPMKAALAVSTRHAEGSATEAILRWALDGPSWDDMAELRAERPEAVIEFGCYAMPVGRKMQNAVIWEVRETY